MKALVFHKPGTVSVDQVPDPKIQHPEDVILRVTSTAICGSDLHIYNGFFPQPRPLVLGHEFMGIVEETGTRRDDNSSAATASSFPSRSPAAAVSFVATGCLATAKTRIRELWPGRRPASTEKGGALFGYTDLYGGYDGGQAEYVRVPFANFGPAKCRTDFRTTRCFS